MHLKWFHFLVGKSFFQLVFSCWNVSNTDGNKKLFCILSCLNNTLTAVFQCLSDKEEQRKQYDYQEIHDFRNSFLPSTRLLPSAMSHHHMMSTQQQRFSDFLSCSNLRVPSQKNVFFFFFSSNSNSTWTHSKSILEESLQVPRLYFCQYLSHLLFSTQTFDLQSKPA